MRVLYMCAPVSGDIAGNLARAKRWLRWLNAAPAYQDAAVICPWMTDLEVLPLRDDGQEERERGMQKCEATAARCDGVILVGGRISNGMAREAAASRAAGKRVIDMTGIGFTEEPPSA